MIHLVFVACLTATPGSCTERTLTYVEPMTPYACAMRAQPELAKWTERHPTYTVTQWRCEAEGQRRIRV